MKSLAGTGTMIRFVLRRDRIIIPLYVLVFATMVAGQAMSSEELYATQVERETYAATAASGIAHLV